MLKLNLLPNNTPVYRSVSSLHHPSTILTGWCSKPWSDERGEGMGREQKRNLHSAPSPFMLTICEYRETENMLIKRAKLDGPFDSLISCTDKASNVGRKRATRESI